MKERQQNKSYKIETPLKVSSWSVIKRFLIIFLPLAALLAGILRVLYYTEVKNERNTVEDKSVHTVDIHMQIIASDLELIVSDLMFLSEQNELQRMFERPEAGHRRALAEEYLSFCARKGLYDQIRFLDETGMEVVRVNFNSGKPSIVPDEQLQPKAKRYYFKDTFLLGQGEVFVSPFDLNIERGEIEQPLKSMIRFGTPVFDSHGRKRGIVLLNYLGAKLIYDFERASVYAPGQVLLLNSNGFWLHGPRPEDEWGFMFEDGKDRTFGNAFPESWSRVSGAESGQFYNADGMFTFTTVYPLLEGQKSSTGSGKAFKPSVERLEAKEYYWKVVFHIPPDVLNAGLRRFLSRFLLLYAVLVVLLANGSWFLARASVRRKQAEKSLRKAQNELERRVKERTAELVIATQKLQRKIEDHRRAEEEKEKIQAQLLQAQKMEAIGTLAGGVAHDFNNLLTTIQGYIDLTMMEVDEMDPLYGDLKQIRLAAMRAADLTRQLLLFSRKQPMEFTPLNINSTVDDLLKMLDRLIGEDITINIDLEPDSWTVRADAGNIEQVIMNLAVNARDAMPEGGKLTIKTENVTLNEEHSKVIPEARPGKFVCLSVEDTGVGMDKETIQHIFEPFFSTKEAGKGTGLGLSVVYGIVKQHEGWINVYSEPGRSSTFKVYLPAFSIKVEEETKETISLRELQGSGKRILLVEDEEGVRGFATRVLRENGYVVFEAVDAREALDIFEKEKGNFHLVFSDVVLPDKSGLELVDQLLSRKPEFRILLSSGYVDQKSQWSAIRERGFQFIQKPYNLPDLLRAIREAVEQS